LKSSNIAKRYARAFFEIAKEDDKYETYYNELTLFSSILGENENLKELFLNPVFDQDGKKAVVNSILQKINISKTTAIFLKLLVDKKRMTILPEIENAYRQLMDDALKRTRVTVRTAFPLSAELSGKLRDRLEEMTGKKVEMAISEDASLLGGIVVGVGDTLYDGSIKTQLHSIRNLLGEEI
jgi:F-type H+-transporting ATPase subunit delta